MSVLNTFIETVGLNQSFFYHLLLAGILYFFSRKLLFEPYISSMDERHLSTKGRIEVGKDLDLEIQKNKKSYEQKAKSLHKRFQDIFNQSKKKTQAWFLDQSLQIQKKEKSLLKEKRLNLQKKTKEQKELLEKALPELSERLLNKIKA